MTALSAGMTREQAAELLAAHNKDPFHIEHGETVEQTMRYFAREYDPENEEFWGIVGLLHDLDWEEHDDEPEMHTLYAAPLIEEAGGTLNRNFAQREADLPDARVAKHITYTAYLDDADAVISFCKLKSHGMLALSAATKNLFGAIPGTIKPEYHYRYPDPMDFAGMLIDLNEYFRPRLYLVDAVVAMEGNGPTAGTPRPFGALLAGTNPHRIDLLCASLIGLKPENVPTLRAAAERGLTPLDPAQLCVAGDAAAFACPDFRIVQHGTGTDFGARGGTFGRLLGKTAALALRTRPGLKRALCVGCGVCRDVCPAHAITIENGRAHIDRGRCIHCFCCQEFCPRGAMQVHRTVIARIAGHL